MEWRATARTGRPHVKLYEEEKEQPIVILNDFNASMYFGSRIALKSVIAARLAALLAWVSVEQGDRVGGVLVTANRHDAYAPKARDVGIFPWLLKLSEYTALAYTQPRHNHKISQPLYKQLLYLRRVAKPGTTLVLISDFYTLDAQAEKQLAWLQAHHMMIIYHICDPLEMAAPQPNQYPLSDGEHSLVWDTQLRAVRRNYDRLCHAHQQQLQALCQRRQLLYTPVLPDTNLIALVHDTFPRRKRV